MELGGRIVVDIYEGGSLSSGHGDRASHPASRHVTGHMQARG